MKCDIDGMKKSAKTLKNAKDRLKDSVDVINNIMTKLSKEPKNMTEEEAKAYKENCEYVKNELKSLKKRINNEYVVSAKEFKKWITNKAKKLSQSDDLNKEVLYTEERTLTVKNVTGTKLQKVVSTKSLTENDVQSEIQGDNIQTSNERLNKIYEEMLKLDGLGKYFTKKQVESALGKIIICSSDEEFANMYKKSKIQDDINNLESFTYNGKIYIKPNAGDNVLRYEVNRDLAAQKRQANNKKNNGNSTKTTPSQSFNRAMAEYVTRLNCGFLVDRDAEPDYERQEKHDASVKFIMDLQKGLESMGFGDLVLKTGYGTKSELKTKLKEITGNDNFYNSMINSMYTISDKPNATEQEIAEAKKQLENLGKQIQNIDKRVIDGQDVYLEKGERAYFLDTCHIETNDNGKKIQKGSDCFILESVDEEGNTIYGLIDTGMDNTANRVIEYMEELGIKKLDFVLITHGHKDHTGGFEQIYDYLDGNVGSVYLKSEENKTKVNGITKLVPEDKIHYVNDEDNKKKKIKENQTIEFGNYTIQLFNTTDRLAGTDQEDNSNENVNTITALAVANGKTMYFSGDIGNYAGINAEAETTDEVMKYLEEHDLDPSIDLYKMSHHSNSEVNNTDYAIDNLKPKNCVVTNGRKRVNSNKEKFGRAIDRVNKYIEKYGGKMCFTAAGTTVANVTRDDGDLTVKQMPNHWTSGGKKI